MERFKIVPTLASQCKSCEVVPAQPVDATPYKQLI
jgi:hypothetical protein